jgi:hypothetical protein
MNKITNSMLALLATKMDRIKNICSRIKLGLLALTIGFVLQPALVAAQNLANGDLTGGTTRPIQEAAYGGAYVYNDNVGHCGGWWQLAGTLCDEAPTTHSETISSKTTTNSGATYGGYDGTGVLVVDLGNVQTFNQANVFQMFSDGKTTHFRISTHPDTNATAPDWQDAGWSPLNGFDFIDAGTNLGGYPNQVADPTIIDLPVSSSRYVMVEIRNDGSHDDGYWIELRSFKLFLKADGDDISPFKSHAAIAGGAINIAASSTVNGDLAAQAAVVIGANAVVHNIYAGAAVTTGALSTVENIFSGAAAGVGANAHAKNIHAGAAITLGADGYVEAVYAGAAITLGAGASTNDVLTEDANSDDNAEAGDIHNAGNMAEVITLITDTQSALSDLAPSSANGPLSTTMGTRTLAPGVWEGSAVSIAASSTITFDANENTAGENHVWVINLSEALTVGASTHFEIMGLDDTDTATIIWNVGAALTMGAGTSFRGTAFVGGAVNAATSSVSCGHLYATGAISIGSIGVDSNGSPVTCESSDAVFTYLEALD